MVQAHRPHRPHNFRALSKPKQIHKHEHKHYWPYIPVLLLVVFNFALVFSQPVGRRGVLAYATNTSTPGLLDATNQQRAANSVGSLQINGQLNAAAQAKANDMIARNYWSHNTPDGQEPWVFMVNAGYSYERAGENLAYGFTTSDSTVTGWMNSPSHKANLLDSSFTEVGFGFANGENYNNSGQETVVVAMYGKPQVLAAGNSAPTPPAPTPAPVQKQTTPVAQAPTPGPTASETVPTELAKPADTPVTTDVAIVTEPATKQISRIQSLTDGRAPWAIFAVGIMTGLALTVLLVKHAASLRHLIRDSERFILHHPLLDLALVSLVTVGSFLSQTTGFIR